MNRRVSIYLILTALGAGAACGSNNSGPATAGSTTGTDVDASASEAGVPSGPSGIVVLNSDYQSASVSFLDRDGNLLKDGCFNSGSGGPSLTMTLSGDVALPSQSQLGGPAVVIDRQNNTLTARLCLVVAQQSVCHALQRQSRGHPQPR